MNTQKVIGHQNRSNVLFHIALLGTYNNGKAYKFPAVFPKVIQNTKISMSKTEKKFPSDE